MVRHGGGVAQLWRGRQVELTMHDDKGGLTEAYSLDAKCIWLGFATHRDLHWRIAT
jgi:hypothetical protein